TNATEEYEKAEINFLNILKKCKMDSIFSIATYKKWIIDEKNFGPQFVSNALLCLVPTDLNDKDFEKLLYSAAEFGNNIPKPFLNGKSSSEVYLELKSGDQRFEMNIFSKEKYLTKIVSGHAYMKDNNYEVAYETFEGVVKDLLEDKIPFFDTFRIYANAAVCSMASEDMGLGEELLEASLRINPQYHFAKRAIEREIAPYNDFSNVKKGYKKFAKAARGVVKEDGIRRYRRSPFRKYEDWLKKIGVSLDYETQANITLYDKKNTEIKIGRNDPCYCKSNKKFKKCHGI
ncbi:MAG: SEC-C domain-containing protein, partial [Patescibacteria group bacterium]